MATLELPSRLEAVLVLCLRVQDIDVDVVLAIAVVWSLLVVHSGCLHRCAVCAGACRACPRMNGNRDGVRWSSSLAQRGWCGIVAEVELLEMCKGGACECFLALALLVVLSCCGRCWGRRDVER